MSRAFLMRIALLLPIFTSPTKSAVPTPDPYSHTDPNAWFNPPPLSIGSFFAGAKVATVHHVVQTKTPDSLFENTTAVQTPPWMTGSNATSTVVAAYRHYGTPGSGVDAIGEAVADGCDVVTIDMPCSPPPHGGSPLLDAVSQAVWNGAVILCAGEPSPALVSLGVDPVNVTFALAITRGGAGTAYSSTLQRAAQDLHVRVVPGTLVFKAADQVVDVTVTFSAEGGGSGGRTRWRLAVVEWARADGLRVGTWPFVVRVV